MKKNALLLLLMGAMLTGCDFLPFLNQKQTQPENNTQETDDSHEEEHHEEEHQDDDDQEEKEDLVTEYTQTIKFSGNDFHAIATAAGVQINDSEYAENVRKLTEYCDSFLEYENLISSLSCTRLNTAEWNEKVYLCVGTGYYANNKFNAGKLQWNSIEKIYKVQIKAQAYAKLNNYSGNTYDYPAHVWIDNDDHSLEFASPAEPTLQTFEKTYTEGVTKFVISSTGARVLLDEITITWRG